MPVLWEEVSPEIWYEETHLHSHRSALQLVSAPTRGQVSEEVSVQQSISPHGGQHTHLPVLLTVPLLFVLSELYLGKGGWSLCGLMNSSCKITYKNPRNPISVLLIGSTNVYSKGFCVRWFVEYYIRVALIYSWGPGKMTGEFDYSIAFCRIYQFTIGTTGVSSSRSNTKLEGLSLSLNICSEIVCTSTWTFWEMAAVWYRMEGEVQSSQVSLLLMNMETNIKCRWITKGNCFKSIIQWEGRFIRNH